MLTEERSAIAVPVPLPQRSSRRWRSSISPSFRDAIDPCAQAARPIEVRQGIAGLDKGGLKHALCVVGVAYQAQGASVDQRREALDQAGAGVGVVAAQASEERGLVRIDREIAVSYTTLHLAKWAL